MISKSSATTRKIPLLFASMDVMMQQTHSQDLLIYLYKLYQGKSLCDIDIESRDGVVFHTHRVVFAAVSSHFHNMILLRPDLAGLKLNIDSNVLQLLLDFGYTGQLFISKHLRQDIHNAASLLEMYSVLDLMNKHSGSSADIGFEPATDRTRPELQDLGPVTAGRSDGDTGTSDRTGDREDLQHRTETEGFIIEYVNDLETKMDAEETESVPQNLTTGGNIPKSRKETKKGKSKSKLRQKNKDRLLPGILRGERSKVKDTLKVKRSQKITKGQMSKLKRVDKDKQTCDNRMTRLKVKSRKESVIHVCNDMIKIENESVKILSPENDKTQKSIQKSGKFKIQRTKTKKCVKESKSLNLKVNNGGGGQKTRRKMSLKCRYCPTRLPLHLPIFCHQHMYKHHQDHYLNMLFSRFLTKKGSQCNTGTKFSYWQTGSKSLINCNICSKKFRRYSLFSLHYSRVHWYKRKDGWFGFLSAQMHTKLKKKKNTNSNKTGEQSLNVRIKNTFQCSACSKVFASEVNLANHTTKYHEVGAPTQRRQQFPLTDAFKCFLCGRCLLSENTLRKHLQRVHSQTQTEAKLYQYETPEEMKCEVNTCQFTSSNLLTLRHHMTELHPYIAHGCQLCSARFKVPLMLERHVVSKHSVVKETSFGCTKCCKTFPRAQSLKRHEHFKHGIVHESVKVYRCDHEGCSYITSSSSSLKLHQSKHIKEKRFTCEFCGLKLKTQVSHRKHINKMHLGVRPYLCQVCGQSFGEDHELKSHFNYKHATEKGYKCQLCPYATHVKSTFFTHLFNVHNVRDKDDKRQEYQCTLCPFKSILHHRYKIHVNSHTNTREYWCNICDKSFISSSTLHAHKQWFHSETVFLCTQCDYQTKTQQKLNEHIRIQHQLKGLKPYKCPYCEFRCATGGNTRKHIKQVHRGCEVHYIRDTGLLDAARIARVSGHHAPLTFPSVTQPGKVESVHTREKDSAGNGPHSSLNNPTVIIVP